MRKFTNLIIIFTFFTSLIATKMSAAHPQQYSITENVVLDSNQVNWISWGEMLAAQKVEKRKIIIGGTSM